ncbi:MAG: cytochrome c oxidase subunit 3 [Pyrinomonadaceae bacterium]
MEIGTAETNLRKKKSRLKPTLSSSLGAGGGRKNPGGGGGNGGDNFPGKDFSEQKQQQRSNKLRITMGFMLLVVLMTFGVLIGAYIVTATNGTLEWKPFENLPAPVWVSTFLILASSGTYKIFQNYLFIQKQKKAKNWLLATTILGAVFISSQILAWFALAGRGVYVHSNPYAGFFYILTAVHAVHVIVGIIILGYIVLRTWNETDSETELAQRKNISNTVGWYWHFMGALWIVLFLLLAFYK